MPLKDFETNDRFPQTELGIGLLAVAAIAGAFLFLFKKKSLKKSVRPLRDVDIEIRYETEKDADTTFLAQNIVKIVRIVLSPLASHIKKEQAKLVFVFGGESWEMRTIHASDYLKNKIRSYLESREW